MSDHTNTSPKSTQVQSKVNSSSSPKQQASAAAASAGSGGAPPSKKGPCPWLCNLVPTNLPAPGPAQAVLHPRKDVFVLKVSIQINW